MYYWEFDGFEMVKVNCDVACSANSIARSRELAIHFGLIKELLDIDESVIVSEWGVKRRKSVNKRNYVVRDENDFQEMVAHYEYHEYWTYCITLILNGPQFAWMWKTIQNYPQFRKRFFYALSSYQQANRESYSSAVDKPQNQARISLKVHFVILESALLILDKLGSTLSNSYVSVRCELETALSWLSTLGGAFSALGDLSVNYATEAAQVSIKQLKIAWKLNDPLIGSRCRLYMAISLLQRGSLRTARSMVKKEYKYALSVEAMDPRLRRMCLGVWAKLQYAWTLRQKRKALSLQTATKGKCCSNNFTGMDNSQGTFQMPNGSL